MLTPTASVKVLSSSRLAITGWSLTWVTLTLRSAAPAEPRSEMSFQPVTVSVNCLRTLLVQERLPLLSTATTESAPAGAFACW